jgi:agmatine deiminase
MRCYSAPFVLEGGGFSVDGEGTLIATEQFLLNPNRNPDWSREQIEQGLRDYLAVEKVIWLAKGLVEDRETDGHSDNVVQFLEPGVVLAQTVRDESNPNYELLQDNLQRLQKATDAKGRRLEVVEMDILPYTEPIDGVRYPVPYVNYYVVNGGAVVPALGGEEDEEGLARMAEILSDREIATVPSTAMALGGGGVGCITQQQPAGKPLR